MTETGFLARSVETSDSVDKWRSRAGASHESEPYAGSKTGPQLQPSASRQVRPAQVTATVIHTPRLMFNYVRPILDYVQPMLNYVQPILNYLRPLILILRPPISILEPLILILRPPISILEPLILILEPLILILRPPISILEPLISILHPLISILGPMFENVRPMLNIPSSMRIPGKPGFFGDFAQLMPQVLNHTCPSV